MTYKRPRNDQISAYLREEPTDDSEMVAFLKGVLNDPKANESEKAEARRLLALPQAPNGSPPVPLP